VLVSKNAKDINRIRIPVSSIMTEIVLNKFTYSLNAIVNIRDIAWSRHGIVILSQIMSDKNDIHNASIHLFAKNNIFEIMTHLLFCLNHVVNSFNFSVHLFGLLIFVK
jgi:hypothetical protein